MRTTGELRMKHTVSALLVGYCRIVRNCSHSSFNMPSALLECTED